MWYQPRLPLRTRLVVDPSTVMSCCVALGLKRMRYLLTSKQESGDPTPEFCGGAQVRVTDGIHEST